MRFALALLISISGWVLTGTYIATEYVSYGSNIFHHMLNFTSVPTVVFHFFIFTAPLFSAFFGYLVNERFKLMDGLREFERRYRDYYENAPQGYHSALSDGTIAEVNATWLRMMGYEREEVVGRMRLADLVEASQREEFERSKEEFIKTGSMEEYESLFKKKDGSYIPVLLGSTAIYDSGGRFLRSRTIVRDITERKIHEEALRNASSEWRATFDSMPWGVMLLDEQCSILRANEYVSRQVGLPYKELLGRKCHDAVHGSARPIEGCALLKSMKSNATEMSEFYDSDRDRHFRVYCQPVKAGEEVKTFVHSIVDITDIRKNEKKLLDSRNAYFNMLKDGTEAFKNLTELHNNLILSFANAIDAKSHWTKGHSERVTHYAEAIAREMGLRESEVDTLRTAALLHDIGKIGTYDFLLDKPGKLTDEEFEIVKQHPGNGAMILEPIGRFKSIIDIVRYHHERFDGRGYPAGLSGEDIPLLARILCVADSFDAMTADRPYRPSPGTGYAIGELKRCAGRQFDPQAAGALVSAMEKKNLMERERATEHGDS